jgi:RNA polymerase sigma-70 factor (ECF subfamily)
MFCSSDSGKVTRSEASNFSSLAPNFTRDEEGKTMATESNSLVNPGNASMAHSGQICEAQLVTAAKNGHHAAFGELYARHSQRILRTALRITKNREDAEDALQDSFTSALVHLGSFDGRSSFSTWLTRIAINSALMTLRKHRACPEISRDEAADEREDFAPYDPVDPHPDPEQQFAQRQREQILAEAVRGLRPTLRQVIEIRRLQELSLKETARTLRITLPAVKSRLFHARVVLRQRPAMKALVRGRVRRAA